MTRFKTHKRDISADLFATQKSSDAFNTNAEPNAENAASGGFKNAYAEASQSSSSRRQPVQAHPVTLPLAQIPENPSPDQMQLPARIAPSENTPLVEVAGTEEKPSVRSRKPGKRRDKSKTLSRCMTVSDVADQMKVSVSTVWRLQGRDPSFPKPCKIGGSKRWDRQALTLYLDRQFDVSERCS